MEVKKRNKNLKLIGMIYQRRMRQYDLVNEGALRNEAQASRIINGLTEPTGQEIERICHVLKCKPSDVGLLEPKKPNHFVNEKIKGGKCE